MTPATPTLLCALAQRRCTLDAAIQRIERHRLPGHMIGRDDAESRRYWSLLARSNRIARAVFCRSIHATFYAYYSGQRAG